MRIVLFVHRPFADDDTLKIVECVTCGWRTIYNEVLWTSNDMPIEQTATWSLVREHGRREHRAQARILRGWKP